MASNPSNFDAEIKKGMSGPAAKKSDGGVPSKAPKASGGFNGKPKPSPAQPQDQSANTHQAMIDAGNAHMAAIHAHVNSIKGC